MSTELKYLSRKDLDSLAEVVNESIERGWKPYGNVVASSEPFYSLGQPPSSHMRYIQSMIRHIKPEKHKPTIPPPPDQVVVPITPMEADGL